MVAPTDIIIAIGALAGLGTGWERVRRPTSFDARSSPATRVAIVVAVTMLAGTFAESGRGLVYLILMPIGAYKVAQVAAELIAAARAGRALDS